ncbi:TniQ family protein [Ralstonia pseudosolanacearum]|uniref:TniQ family protein n=1 Tax=Ralstonia pseudosolanacearum TaxID=1310165 RepID=UPI0009B8642D
MDTPHAGHPGAICVRPIWTIPVDLQSDELLSSWLVRVALENGCDPLALTAALWPSRRAWSSDIDRYLPEFCQQVLVAKGGIDSNVIRGAMLVDVARCICDDVLPMHGRWPWILAVRARNRRRLGGLQFCPDCLAADQRPFFRRRWRFAWCAVCLRHGRMLLDHCPHCHAAIEPHRLTAELKSVAQCATCTALLTDAGQGAPAEPFAAQLQASTELALAGNGIEYANAHLSITEWFAILDTWLGLARRAALAKEQGLMRLVAMLGFPPLPWTETRTWESFEAAERAVLLTVVGKLISLDASQLVASFLDAGLSRQAAFPRGVPPIPVMRDIAGALPDRLRHRRCSNRMRCDKKLPEPRSRREVARRMERLRRAVARVQAGAH